MYKTTIVTIFILCTLTLGFADLRSAIDSLENEICKDPSNYVFHFQLGAAYQTLEEYDNALIEFTRAIELKPDHFLSKFKIATTYYFMDSLTTAMEKFEKLKQAHSDKYAIYEYLGMIYLTLGEYEKMLYVYDECLQVSEAPQYSMYGSGHLLCSCGEACNYLGRYHEASRYYEQALKEAKYATHWQIILAMTYKKLSDTLQANKWLQQGIKELAPAMRYYHKESLGRTRIIRYRSRYYYLMADYPKAIADMEELIRNSEAEFVDQFNYGVYRIAAGDTAGLTDIRNAASRDTNGTIAAIYEAMRAIRSDSSHNVETYLKQNTADLAQSGIANGLLAWALTKLGRQTEAQKYWIGCYGYVPLGIDMESIICFIEEFVETLKESE